MKSHTCVFFDVVDVTFVVHQVFVVLLIQGWVRLQLGLKPWMCNRQAVHKAIISKYTVVC